jgi:hypothetical protein
MHPRSVYSWLSNCASYMFMSLLQLSGFSELKMGARFRCGAHGQSHRREAWTLESPKRENLHNELGSGLKLFRHSGVGTVVELAAEAGDRRSSRCRSSPPSQRSTVEAKSSSSSPTRAGSTNLAFLLNPATHVLPARPFPVGECDSLATCKTPQIECGDRWGFPEGLRSSA